MLGRHRKDVAWTGGKLCPLFSAADPGAEEYSKCKGESCSMWSRKHRRCGLRSV